MNERTKMNRCQQHETELPDENFIAIIILQWEIMKKKKAKAMEWQKVLPKTKQKHFIKETKKKHFIK